MKTLFFVIFFLILPVLGFSQAPDTLWTSTFGGTNDDTGYSVQETSDGGYIITGYTKLFGAGWYDVYLIRTNSNGDALWTKTYGGEDYDEGRSVIETSDNGYIIAGRTFSFGAGSEDVYLIKTNSNGDTIWTRTYGGNLNDAGYSIKQTSDNGYIVTGHTRSFGGGAWYDLYLIKTDANGDTLWTKTYGDGGDYYDGGYSVQETDDNGYIVAGWTVTPCGQDYHWDVYLINTDTNGDSLWTKKYGGTDDDKGYSVEQTTDGGYIVVGHTESFGAGSRDVYLIKTNADGDTIWTRTYGGTNQDAGSFVQEIDDEGYIIAGYTKSFGAGGYDVYLIKTDANGITLWTSTYGGQYWDEGQAVQQTSDGGYIVVGYASSFGAGLWDVYLIKTETDPVGTDDELVEVPAIFSLHQNYPNPFNPSGAGRSPSTTIYFETTNLHEKSRIEIFNIKGQKIRTFSIPQFEIRNPNCVVWNGKDENNKPVASGVYLYKLKSGKYSDTKKMILMK